jgi:type IV secretion system protein VirD4
MSQLDALYGDREARTFSTNHGVQILFAPREQRDAQEYSAMLGDFTERATSHGRSRTFSSTASSSVSRNESDQRRALLLPQEFKELGSERLVVILENCKPILGEKIRYYRDRILRQRLLPAPVVPAMDIDLHVARAQQRWRYADEVLEPGTQLFVEQFACDLARLPSRADGPPGDVACAYIAVVGDLGASQQAAGGVIEPAPDADGVLVAEPGAIGRAPSL